jgi:hypothetical protein
MGRVLYVRRQAERTRATKRDEYACEVGQGFSSLRTQMVVQPNCPLTAPQNRQTVS